MRRISTCSTAFTRRRGGISSEPSRALLAGEGGAEGAVFCFTEMGRELAANATERVPDWKLQLNGCQTRVAWFRVVSSRRLDLPQWH